MAKVPTRSPTHQEIDYGKLAGLGLDLDDVVDDGVVALPKLIELAEDRGRPASHYLAGLALASEYQLAMDDAPVKVIACVGKCQSWGALDCLDHAVDALAKQPKRFALAVRSCLDRCDHAAVIQIDSPAGTLVVTEASPRKLDEALAAVES
jgi:NADH:ubiquinone oxidoreductase subunit E